MVSVSEDSNYPAKAKVYGTQLLQQAASEYYAIYETPDSCQ